MVNGKVINLTVEEINARNVEVEATEIERQKQIPRDELKRLSALFTPRRQFELSINDEGLVHPDTGEIEVDKSIGVVFSFWYNAKIKEQRAIIQNQGG